MKQLLHHRCAAFRCLLLGALTVGAAGCEPLSDGAASIDAVDAAVPGEQAAGFRAVGQEPGWILYILPDHGLDFRYDYGEARARTPLPSPSESGDVTTWHAVTEASDLRVEIKDAACNDVMSGAPYPATVSVTLNGRDFSGCGGPVSTPIASGQYCYAHTTPEGAPDGDRVLLRLEVDGLRVSGSFDWLPAEKDSRRGTLDGVLTGHTIVADYRYTQEGTTASATLRIELNDATANVSGGLGANAFWPLLAATDCDLL